MTLLLGNQGTPTPDGHQRSATGRPRRSACETRDTNARLSQESQPGPRARALEHRYASGRTQACPLDRQVYVAMPVESLGREMAVRGGEAAVI